MPAYRFYTLPRHQNDFPLERTFYKDSVAVGWAFKQAGADGIEVWEGSRFVARLHGGVTADAEAPWPRTAP